MFNNNSIGKPDEQFIDPKTGEKVSRVKVPEKLINPIEEFFNKNSNHANNFLQLARQSVITLKQLMKEFDLASEGEIGVQKTVVTARERMGLDSSWIYNVPMKMMEKREPPDPSAIESSKPEEKK